MFRYYVLFVFTIYLAFRAKLAFAEERRMRAALLISFPLLVILSFAFSFWNAYSLCKTRGGFHSPGQLPVQGFFFSRDWKNNSDTHRDISKLLIIDKFQYIETERISDPTKIDGSRLIVWNSPPLERNALKFGTKYYRYFLADEGDPACAGFAQMDQRDFRWYRELGIGEGKCIATIAVDHLISDYALVEQKEFIWSGLLRVKWHTTAIQNIDNEIMHSYFRGFRICYFGKVPYEIGYSCRKIGEVREFSCPAGDNRYKSALIRKIRKSILIPDDSAVNAKSLRSY